MESLDLVFCNECSEKILSRELSIFWKFTCLNSIRNGAWVPFFEMIDNTDIEYLVLLEKKGFLITLDHERKIFAKPHGISRSFDHDCYQVCISPTKHNSNE